MITLNAHRAPAGDAVDLLLECHGRIRWFCAMALRLLEPQLEPSLVADGARRVHRYFSVALPLHVADEDLSLRARLEQARELHPLLDTLQAEHGTIDGGLAELLPKWELLGTRPEQVEELRAVLEPRTRALAELFETHLKREETELFPAVRRLLSKDVLASFAGEMRARRQAA